VTETAAEMIAGISDARERRLIVERIRGLENAPEFQGKPLMGELRGLYSLRAAGQPYRIIYHIIESRVVVLIVAVGIRKERDKRDVYALARRLLRLGLLDEPSAE
jgi:mRNA interferase RelE/StbE